MTVQSQQLSQSPSSTLPPTSFPQFDALRLAFEVVQIPPSSSDAIFSCLSAILHLGNLSYCADSETNNHNDRACLAPGDEQILHTAAGLLGVETQELQKVTYTLAANLNCLFDSCFLQQLDLPLLTLPVLRLPWSAKSTSAVT